MLEEQAFSTAGRMGICVPRPTRQACSRGRRVSPGQQKTPVKTVMQGSPDGADGGGRVRCRGASGLVGANSSPDVCLVDPPGAQGLHAALFGWDLVFVLGTQKPSLVGFSKGSPEAPFQGERTGRRKPTAPPGTHRAC